VRTLLSSFSLKLLGQESLLSARRPVKKMSLPPSLLTSNRRKFPQQITERDAGKFDDGTANEGADPRSGVIGAALVREERRGKEVGREEGKGREEKRVSASTKKRLQEQI
jgi:hypothetical protein